MAYDGQLLKGTVSIMVLKLLTENDRYGYQIIRELEKRSESVFLLNEGALYPVLHKLETDEQISSYWEESGGRKRKYYHITPKGTELFESKRQEWADFAGMVSKILKEFRRGQLCTST
ncbi:MAG: PadR family transcriptional regulator [Oscillospiraceae bacterium]|nr:PadR family transcriptional regulator [Oscillospiraceae bacterium]